VEDAVKMATFVLVHGAWQTAATWDLVSPKLQAGGHRVVVPLLSGLENDSTTLSPAVGLQTHIGDVLGVLTLDNLRDVILIGHSYAGMIISAVAEHAPQRLDRLVYVDAFVPSDGQSAMDLFPPAFADRFRQRADKEGEGWLLRPSEATLDGWGLKPGAEREFVKARLSDFSIRCFAEAAKLPTNAATRFRRTYVACVAEGYPARAVFKPFGDRAKQEGWSYRELPTGHDCHIEAPDAFVSILFST
jgi:pimeloyl-ACP methyl ester carboxylesterase